MKKSFVSAVTSLALLFTPLIASGNNETVSSIGSDEAMVDKKGNVISYEKLVKETTKLPKSELQEVVTSKVGTGPSKNIKKATYKIPTTVKVYDPLTKKTKSFNTKKLLASSYSTPGIYGTDNRTRITKTKSSPYSAMGAFFIFFDDDSFLCSGSYIDRNSVLSAGHCFYHPESKKMADGAVFIPALSANSKGEPITPFGITEVTNIHIPQGWKKGNLKYDYSLVTTSDHLGKQTGSLGIRSISQLTGKTVHVVGYPGMKPEFTMWKGSGSVKGETTRIAYHKIDMTQGQSGGPTYQYSSKYGYYAVAVNSHIDLRKKLNASTKLAPKAVNAIKYWATKDNR